MRLTIEALVSLLLIALIIPSCTKDSLGDPAPEEMNEGSDDDMGTAVDGIIWNGPVTTFTKGNNADPNAEANQDRITDNVWITRGNDGGQIYNAKVENDANKVNSPDGTRWAIGTLDQVNSLQFGNFRAAVGSPKNVVGKNLVLHLEADNIYLSVKFTSWAQGKAGGFSYERSTAQ